MPPDRTDGDESEAADAELQPRRRRWNTIAAIQWFRVGALLALTVGSPLRLVAGGAAAVLIVAWIVGVRLLTRRRPPRVQRLVTTLLAAVDSHPQILPRPLRHSR